MRRLLFLLLLLAAFSPAARAADPPAPFVDFSLAPKDFVAACLRDPRIFVLNPPPDQDSHADLSPQDHLSKSIAAPAKLMLHPDALPRHFAQGCQLFTLAAGDPSTSFRPAAPSPALIRIWYATGQLQLEENYSDSGLVSARYFDPFGKILGQIKDGTGTALALSDSAAITRTVEYQAGKRHGKDILWADYATGLKSRQSSYVAGLKDGLHLQWASDGWLNILESYHDGKAVDRVLFDAAGNAHKHFDSRPEDLLPHYDPKPYLQKPLPRPNFSAAPQSHPQPWPTVADLQRRRELAAKYPPPVGTLPGVATRAAPPKLPDDLLSLTPTLAARPADNALLSTPDAGKTWTPLPLRLDFTPTNFATQQNTIAILGHADDPKAPLGRAYFVSFSRDTGKTFRTLRVPADVATGITFFPGQPEPTLTIVAKYIPKAGLPDGDHWLLLPDWFLQTTTGNAWTKMAPPLYSGPGKLLQKLPLPDHSTVYVLEVPGFLDPGGFSVFLVRSLQDQPTLLAHTSARPKLTLTPTTLEIAEPQTKWQDQRTQIPAPDKTVLSLPLPKR